MHMLIERRDPEYFLNRFIKDMTTKDYSSIDTSFYAFWKQRLTFNIEPVQSKNRDGFQSKKVSDILLDLFIRFLFSENEFGGIEHSSDLDMVGINLVMIEAVVGSPGCYTSRMMEPIVIMAGINFMTDTDSALLMKYFASKLFTSNSGVGHSAQERGNLMETAIAIRFLQAWWTEDGMERYLPDWALKIPIPKGIVNKRTGMKDDTFLKQLRDPQYPYVLLPPTQAGPDLRYSVFSCYCKTTWTRNSKSSMYVSNVECAENRESKERIGGLFVERNSFKTSIADRGEEGTISDRNSSVSRCSDVYI